MAQLRPRARVKKGPLEKSGRPVKYRKEFCVAVKHMVKAGLTEEQMAYELGIVRATFDIWKNKYQDFADVLSETRETADEIVEKNLYQLAVGNFEITETTVTGIPDRDGKIVPKSITKTTKLIPPNVQAQMFWLRNRQRDKWRDQQNVQVDATLEIVLPQTREARDAEIERIKKEIEKEKAKLLEFRQ